MFGNPEVTTGGKALKFYASIRLDVRKSDVLKDTEGIIGNHTKVKVVKNKLAPPFKTAEFDIMYGTGISREGSAIDLAVLYGVLDKSGAWFSYNGEKIGQGREKTREYLVNNKEVLEEIENKILEIFKKKNR